MPVIERINQDNGVVATLVCNIHVYILFTLLGATRTPWKQ
jgi:hypothetical protein